jgi:endoglycosylceramidase
MRRAVPLAVLLLAACGGDDAHRTSPLWSDGTYLRDADGRIALLRGVNARVQGVFDVTFDDGRTALEPIPALTADDCTRMRQLGLDLLRLPINWSAIEPSDGIFDDSYLSQVDAAIQCAGDAGLFVLVDLHQDAYSKEIGEDGAPLWAIVPPPDMLLGGPLTDLGTRRNSTQVNRAFDSFFDPSDAAGLQAKFEDMLDVVAARWADDPAVIGYEIFNEPPVGEDEVDAFSPAAAARVRAAAPDKLVFFEPSAVRNIVDFVPTPSHAFPVDDAVYAPHVYTMIFTGTSTDYSLGNLEPSVKGTRAEAAAWHTPLVIGEYGTGPGSTNADEWMGNQALLHDRYLAGDAFWVWKEESQASWGVFDHDATTDTWTERPQVVAWLSRIHAARIAGDVVSNDFDPSTGALRLYTKHSTGKHDIYIPERDATSFSMTCEGAALTATRDPTTGLVSVPCDGVLLVDP